MKNSHVWKKCWSTFNDLLNKACTLLKRSLMMIFILSTSIQHKKVLTPPPDSASTTSSFRSSKKKWGVYFGDDMWSHLVNMTKIYRNGTGFHGNSSTECTRYFCTSHLYLQWRTWKKKRPHSFGEILIFIDFSH